jgi:hypothetical protein
MDEAGWAITWTGTSVALEIFYTFAWTLLKVSSVQSVSADA